MMDHKNDSRVFAFAALVMFCTMSVLIAVYGNHTARVLVITSLMFAGMGQFIGQVVEDKKDIILYMILTGTGALLSVLAATAMALGV